MKLIKLLQILRQESDENHCLSANMLVDRLAQENIIVERKTIYSDIKKLNQCGYTINYDQSKKGYYLESDLSLTDIKIINDALNAQRFLSNAKIQELITNINANLSIHEQKILEDISINNPSKITNNTTVYNLNEIINALIANEDITFNYADTTFSKKHFRYKNGKIATYKTKPCYLILANDNYYLISYSYKYKSYSHYRLDRMVNIKNTPSIDIILPPIDIQKYLFENFNMNIGPKENIVIRFKNKVEHIVYDRLQDSAIKTYQDDESFIINFNSIISNDLLAWIISFKNDAEVLSPQSLKDDLLSLANSIINIYKVKENKNG